MLHLHKGILIEINESFLILSNKVQKSFGPNHLNRRKEQRKLKKKTYLCLCKKVIFFKYIYSCLAGESVHFFNEVHELSKIPEDDCVSRIYMARHIIEKYIVAGLYF